jgi:hypothetical protein
MSVGQRLLILVFCWVVFMTMLLMHMAGAILEEYVAVGIFLTVPAAITFAYVRRRTSRNARTRGRPKPLG